MQKRSVTAALACFFAVTAASCAQTSQTAQTSRFCPPLFQLKAIQPLGCYIYGNHLLGVGNPSAIAIPKGTPVSFAAKLVNAGPYCATVPAPEPIPPHLFVVITGQPLFDDQAPCQAWREVAPVFTQ
jgi:hypothetical protein